MKQTHTYCCFPLDSLLSSCGHITFLSLQGMFCSGLLHILLSPPGARQSFLQHLSQALPVSHCHRDSVCLLESLQRCAQWSPGMAEEGRPWADLELRVPWREFCAQVLICVAVSVQKGSRIQKCSTTEMSSWGPARRLEELIPNALGHLRHFC